MKWNISKAIVAVFVLLAFIAVANSEKKPFLKRIFSGGSFCGGSENVAVVVETERKLLMKESYHVASPIPIESNHVQLKEEFIYLMYENYWPKEGAALIENIGTTAKLTFEGVKAEPYIKGGIFKTGEKYVFDHMHFHWRKTDDTGCEHTIDGKCYAIEVHMVHRKSIYATLEKALQNDGVVVVALYIQANGDKPNQEFAKITDYLDKIKDPHSKPYKLKSDCLKWMELGATTLGKNYFSYKGSLTTPPYTAAVTWIIYKTPINASKKQVAAFRHLLKEDKSENHANCRELQTKPLVGYQPWINYVGEKQ